MKRTISAVIAVLICLFWCICTAYAEDADINAVTNELGIDIGSIESGISDELKDKLAENNITTDNTDELVNVTAGDVFKYILDEIKSKIKYPMRLFSSLICIIVVNAAVNGFSDCLSNKSLEKIYNMVTVLIVTSIISGPIADSVALTSETLTSGAEFMMCYIPVFSGIVASSGSITSAAAYNTALMLAAEAAVWIAAEYIMPVLSVCMSLGIIEAVNPSFGLTSVTDAIAKGVKFILGFVMTIFIGLLSLQSIIGTSADSLGIKAAKYLASNVIPVVGSAVADAYTTIKSSLGILRGGTGFFGIAAIFYIVMPVIIELGLMRVVFMCSEMLCEMLNFGNIRIVIKNTSSVLSMMLSLIICFAMMLVISTAILMSLGLNMY